MNTNYTIKILDKTNLRDIQEIFVDVFTQEPWNDDWSNTDQLEKYMLDIIGNSNSLSIGFYRDNKIQGCSLGNIIHWYTGTEYYIREFFISKDNQNKGLGSLFLGMIHTYLLENKIRAILLSTEIETPAYKFYMKNGFNELEKNRFFYKKIE